MQLQWKASLSASCLHAAACFQEGLPVADARWVPALGEPIEQLLGELRNCGLMAEDVLPQLGALTGEIDNNRQLVELALRSTKLAWNAWWAVSRAWRRPCYANGPAWSTN